MDRKEFMTTMAARMIACGSLVLVKDGVPTFSERVVEQSQQVQKGRKPVIPQQVIDEFKMQPTEGYGLWVMGEDGKPYSLDEVLLILFTIVRSHWGGDQQRQMAAPKRKQ